MGGEKAKTSQRQPVEPRDSLSPIGRRLRDCHKRAALSERAERVLGEEMRISSAESHTARL